MTSNLQAHSNSVGTHKLYLADYCYACFLFFFHFNVPVFSCT